MYDSLKKHNFTKHPFHPQGDRHVLGSIHSTPMDFGCWASKSPKAVGGSDGQDMMPCARASTVQAFPKPILRHRQCQEHWWVRVLWEIRAVPLYFSGGTSPFPHKVGTGTAPCNISGISFGCFGNSLL